MTPDSPLWKKRSNNTADSETQNSYLFKNYIYIYIWNVWNYSASLRQAQFPYPVCFVCLTQQKDWEGQILHA